MLAVSKPKSKEHRAKIGRKRLIMLQNINSKQIVRVDKDNTDYHTSEWVNPRTLNPEKKMQCMYCNIITNAANINRWHNDNCKRKNLICK